MVCRNVYLLMLPLTGSYTYYRRHKAIKLLGMPFSIVFGETLTKRKRKSIFFFPFYIKIPYSKLIITVYLKLIIKLIIN